MDGRSKIGYKQRQLANDMRHSLFTGQKTYRKEFVEKIVNHDYCVQPTFLPKSYDLQK
jgi:hypothetical protein